MVILEELLAAHPDEVEAFVVEAQTAVLLC